MMSWNSLCRRRPVVKLCFAALAFLTFNLGLHYMTIERNQRKNYLPCHHVDVDGYDFVPFKDAVNSSLHEVERVINRHSGVVCDIQPKKNTKEIGHVQDRLAKSNIVYIKMIKCASETLSTLFYRFGYQRNLSFVLPRDSKIYLGWPYQLKGGFYRPGLTRQFNILTDHAVYNSKAFEALMPKKTVYISSIREPLSQVRSMFSYYNLANIVKMNCSSNEECFMKYMLDLARYDDIYKSSVSSPMRYCIPDGFSMTKNLMAFNLGFSTGWDGAKDESGNETAIKKWLQHISEKFDLIMIVEYFSESLILLKRRLFWTWRDILYLVQNSGQYNRTSTLYRDAKIENIYKKWSPVDYALYNHFNKTLWKHIHTEENDFFGEVTAFDQVFRRVREFCDSILSDKDSAQILDVPRSRWDPGFKLDSNECKNVYMSHSSLMTKVSDEYYRKGGTKDLDIPLPKYVC